MTEQPSAAACPGCGSAVAVGDNFCEHCGREVAMGEVSAGSAGAARCRNCDSTRLTSEGYCENCGQKAPSGRDHLEIDLGTMAGVTDRGRRHHRNEDAMALAVTHTPAGPAALAVVCDGVSTSDQPDEASLIAADTALRAALDAARTGLPSAEVVLTATAAARAAVGNMIGESGDSPATTIVCAVVSQEAVTVAWVGDSRAYWLPAATGSADLDVLSARLLTRDHSAVTELVTAGLLTQAEAATSPRAHELTRWLGADAQHAEPQTAQFAPAGPGIVMLCSDGMWNHQPDPAELAKLAPPGALTSLTSTAARLLEFALDRGGDDNITIALAAFPPRISRTT